MLVDDVVDGEQRLLTLGAELLLLGRQLPRLPGPSCRRSSATCSQLDAEVVGVGLEAGDDTRIHQLPTITLHRSTPFDEHCGDAAGSLAQLLDAHHLVGEVEVATSGQLRLGGHDAGVERGEFGAQFLLGACAA